MVQKEKKFVHFKFKIGAHGVQRTLFLKQHDGTDDIKPSERTLFVVNIPPFMTKQSLEILFSSYGPIEKVYVQSKPSSGLVDFGSKLFSTNNGPSGFKVGYIVFKNPVGLKKVLKLKTDIPILSKKILKSGKNKWIDSYNSCFIDAKQLQQEIDNFMSDFDKKTGEEEAREKRIDGVADEEGWVTVTKQSKKPKIQRNETTSKRLIEKQKRAHIKQTQISFYKCQIKNAKMDEIIEMRKKFEGDKKRLALMKASRNFKPL